MPKTSTTKVKKKLAPKLVDEIDMDDLDDDFEDDAPTRPRAETHRDEADRLVSPSHVNKRPGQVFTRGEITLHTNMAHRLFYGRRPKKENGVQKPGIVGLIRFILNINTICDMAKLDDPYADYWLLELERLLAETRTQLADTKQYLLDLLETGASTNRVSVKSGISESPVTLPLEFKYKQYGFQAAELVGLFDEVVQFALNAKDAAWLTPHEFQILTKGSVRAVRHCFLISSKYKYSGAKRDDFAANNQRARSAIERMSVELPDDVLTGVRQPVWMPQHEIVLPVDAGPEVEPDTETASGITSNYGLGVKDA